ncbi:MAG: hypothetical protein Q4D38_14490 [Planctomycetia bacterium]|nr:hypothetical protein [Planctomycetia bacterium]
MKKILAGSLALAVVLGVGCFGGKPDRVIGPPYNPSAAADKAIAEFDKNSDGKIAGDELDACPSLKNSLSSIDTNGDGGLDKAEISARIQAYIDAEVGLCTPNINLVVKKGKSSVPLKSGNVTLIPEAFMADVLKEAKGTIQDGYCSPSSEGNMENLPGMSYGFYKIQIENADPKIGSAPLGIEISELNPIVKETGGTYKVEIPNK